MACNFKLDGDLFKYANLIKGYQQRYFVLDSNASRLDYFISKESRHQKAKGSIDLKNALIIPSKEENCTFTIHSFENEIHSEAKLKTKDPKDREKWITELKKVCQPAYLQQQKETEPTEQPSAAHNVYECLICYETTSINRVVVTTQCGHIFCKQCIHHWIDVSTVATCPVCKSSIRKEQLIRLYGTDSNSSDTLNDSEQISQAMPEHRAQNTSLNNRHVEAQIVNASNAIAESISNFIAGLVNEFFVNLFRELGKIFMTFILAGLFILLVFFVVLVFIWIYYGFFTMCLTAAFCFLLFKLFIIKI